MSSRGGRSAPGSLRSGSGVRTAARRRTRPDTPRTGSRRRSWQPSVHPSSAYAPPLRRTGPLRLPPSLPPDTIAAAPPPREPSLLRRRRGAAAPPGREGLADRAVVAALAPRRRRYGGGGLVERADAGCGEGELSVRLEIEARHQKAPLCGPRQRVEQLEQGLAGAVGVAHHVPGQPVHARAIACRRGGARQHGFEGGADGRVVE